MDHTTYIIGHQMEAGELASQLVSLLAITMTCSLFGIKTYKIELKQLSYVRLLVINLYVCSWAFTVSAFLLAFTNNGNPTSCLLSILTCDLFYCGTKFIIYLWLIERAYIVSDNRVSRWENWGYRINVLLMSPYIVIFTLMIIYRNNIMGVDGFCYIGLQPIANIPVLVYDTIFNLYMTILFVMPLIRVGKNTNRHWQGSRLHDLTRRSLIASVVCLVASFANALSATIMDGKERGFICLMCCTIDVAINVLTIHWVTTPTKVPINPRQSQILTQDLVTITQPTSSSSAGPQSSSSKGDHSTVGPLPPSLNADGAPFIHTNRSSLSIQGSLCSTQALTNAHPL
ncbi:hypothetical protein DM01DRAFT_1411408 [Hesseltinella vesiculosa]|uniref:G-protein coupled receptors family 2 profile 2 domain-containing protein n=1 Tax=Hesseltinella vesiculosa TaxID=101127 RepID=A0A1X2G3W6_9FUNG|nr:hypothetical protein DM01DRAFT_1411408 [Hesseltinella vesiculosa]